MAKELRTDKFCTGIAFTYETKERLMIKYAKPGEKFPSVVRRVCDELVKDVKLPKPIRDAISRQIAENYAKRMTARAEKARRRTGVQGYGNLKGEK